MAIEWSLGEHIELFPQIEYLYKQYLLDYSYEVFFRWECDKKDVSIETYEDNGGFCLEKWAGVIGSRKDLYPDVLTEHTYDKTAGDYDALYTFNSIHLGKKNPVFDIGTRFYLIISREDDVIRARLAYDKLPNIEQVYEYLLKVFPPKQVDKNPSKCHMKFWREGNSIENAQSTSRILNTQPLKDIIGNYTSGTAKLLTNLATYKPIRGGDLLIFSGSPGTGKTFALQSLFYEWASWARINYILDPITLFSGNATAYLLRLLMGDIEDKSKKWDVIVMEDIGSLLAAPTGNSVHQGVAQFLNITDGIPGRGSKTIFITTTNETIDRLHPAIVRPGRCSCIHEFQALTEDESRVWLKDHDNNEEIKGSHTIAQLYAKLNKASDYSNKGQIADNKLIGFVNPT
jgi:hypothetical protein